MDQELLREKQMLKRLPVCGRTFRTWKSQGLIPHIRVGGIRLYDPKKVFAALEALGRTEKKKAAK